MFVASRQKPNSINLLLNSTQSEHEVTMEIRENRETTISEPEESDRNTSNSDPLKFSTSESLVKEEIVATVHNNAEIFIADSSDDEDQPSRINIDEDIEFNAMYTSTQLSDAEQLSSRFVPPVEINEKSNADQPSDIAAPESNDSDAERVVLSRGGSIGAEIFIADSSEDDDQPCMNIEEDVEFNVKFSSTLLSDVQKLRSSFVLVEINKMKNADHLFDTAESENNDAAGRVVNAENQSNDTVISSSSSSVGEEAGLCIMPEVPVEDATMRDFSDQTLRQNISLLSTLRCGSDSPENKMSEIVFADSDLSEEEEAADNPKIIPFEEAMRKVNEIIARRKKGREE